MKSGSDIDVRVCNSYLENLEIDPQDPQEMQDMQDDLNQRVKDSAE